MHAAVVAAFLTLGACSPHDSSGGAAGQDKFAGLDQEILRWRTDIVAADPLCRSQAEGQKCESFEVACKAERVLTADDQAKGVTARVVAAITWNGFDPKFKQAQSGSRSAEFAKGPAGWARSDHKPVNMQTCADF